MDADIEVQCIGTSTTVGIGIVVGVGARGGVFYFVPSKRLASGLIVTVVGRLIDCQKEGICAGTVESVAVVVGILA